MFVEDYFPNLRHVQAGRFPNPLLRQLHLMEDPQAWATLLQEALPVVELLPLEPGPSWWSYGINLRLGSLVATAWTAKPMRIEFGEHRELIVLLGYGGKQRVCQAFRTWPCGMGCGLLMAAGSFSLECSLSSAVAFALSSGQLLQTALSMGGLPQPPKDWEQIVAQGHAWSPPEDPSAPSLLAALRQTMEMAGQLSGYGKGVLDSLQFEDQIYRLMAALLIPQLHEEKALDRLRHRQRQGRDAFDELIDYVKQNLAEPLTLTDLESRSHYSRRALQYAFAARMGCSATQWIKNQRLDLARKRLENPNLNDTVGSIARDCGYRSLGLFSVDFQQRFHVKPSQLLRESRQN